MTDFDTLIAIAEAANRASTACHADAKDAQSLGEELRRDVALGAAKANAALAVEIRDLLALKYDMPLEEFGQ